MIQSLFIWYFASRKWKPEFYFDSRNRMCRFVLCPPWRRRPVIWLFSCGERKSFVTPPSSLTGSTDVEVVRGPDESTLTEGRGVWPGVPDGVIGAVYLPTGTTRPPRGSRPRAQLQLGSNGIYFTLRVCQTGLDSSSCYQTQVPKFLKLR